MKNKNSDLAVSRIFNQNLLYNFTKNIFIIAENVTIYFTGVVADKSEYLTVCV